MRAGDAIATFQTLPLVGIAELLCGRPALVLAPHADDESLGCGGLIAASCAQDRPPVVVIATDGAGSHPHSVAYPPDRLRALRESEAMEATRRLGLPPDRLHFLRLPDTAAPSVGPAFEAAVTAIADLAAAAGCATIVAPWLHDPHCDHEAAQRMARQVARRPGLALLSYPVWGWTLPPDTELAEPPIRGWRLDMQTHLPAKRRAIAAHRSQYADLITDDPTGFRLPPAFLRVFDRPYEVFLSSA